MTDLDSIDPAFGNWLAGFVDGEGSFNIASPRGACFICTFHLNLRVDDRPILEEMQQTLGLGRVCDKAADVRPGRNGNQQACWDVGGKAPCLVLVRIFDRFPLRAKKARDFAIWREAVFEWNRVGPGKGYWTGKTDWSRMALLRQRLIEGRRFRSEPISTPPARISELEQQSFL